MTQNPGGFLLTDLGSTNGTYVNGVRIAGPIRLTAFDSVTLGRTVPLPWPPELTTFIRIGRLGDNDIVLDDARVSGHHARLIVLAGFQTLIEDIGSSNGTFLNSADCRVTGPIRIAETDTLYFGTLAVPAARLLRAPKEPERRTGTDSSFRHRGQRPRHKPIRSLPVLALVERHRWLLAWLAHVPVLAVVIVSDLRSSARRNDLCACAGGDLVGRLPAVVEGAAGRSQVRQCESTRRRSLY